MQGGRGKQLFDGVVAYVVKWRADGDLSFLSSFVRKLESNGARVASRLQRDVTHIVFQQKALSTCEEQQLEFGKIRELYEKLIKVQACALVVSPLWIQQTINQSSRAAEDAFVIERPAEPEWLHHSLNGSGGCAKRRSSGSLAGRRKSKAFLLSPPKAGNVLDMDVQDELFSSSQQIRGVDQVQRTTGVAGRHRTGHSAALRTLKPVPSLRKRTATTTKGIGVRPAAVSLAAQPGFAVSAPAAEQRLAPSPLSKRLKHSSKSAVSPVVHCRLGHGGGNKICEEKYPEAERAAWAEAEQNLCIVGDVGAEGAPCSHMLADPSPAVACSFPNAVFTSPCVEEPCAVPHVAKGVEIHPLGNSPGYLLTDSYNTCVFNSVKAPGQLVTQGATKGDTDFSFALLPPRKSSSPAMPVVGWLNMSKNVDEASCSHKEAAVHCITRPLVTAVGQEEDVLLQARGPVLPKKEARTCISPRLESIQPSCSHAFPAAAAAAAVPSQVLNQESCRISCPVPASSLRLALAAVREAAWPQNHSSSRCNGASRAPSLSPHRSEDCISKENQGTHCSLPPSSAKGPLGLALGGSRRRTDSTSKNSAAQRLLSTTLIKVPRMKSATSATPTPAASPASTPQEDGSSSRDHSSLRSASLAPSFNCFLTSAQPTPGIFKLCSSSSSITPPSLNTVPCRLVQEERTHYHQVPQSESPAPPLPSALQPSDCAGNQRNSSLVHIRKIGSKGSEHSAAQGLESTSHLTDCQHCTLHAGAPLQIVTQTPPPSVIDLTAASQGPGSTLQVAWISTLNTPFHQHAMDVVGQAVQHAVGQAVQAAEPAWLPGGESPACRQHLHHKTSQHQQHSALALSSHQRELLRKPASTSHPLESNRIDMLVDSSVLTALAPSGPASSSMLADEDHGDRGGSPEALNRAMTPAGVSADVLLTQPFLLGAEEGTDRAADQGCLTRCVAACAAVTGRAPDEVDAPSSPLSVLKTASCVPPVSSIVGSPMTTPHHYTRLQRNRFRDMGLDLGQLPPDHDILVEEDGTVIVTGTGKQGGVKDGEVMSTKRNPRSTRRKWDYEEGGAAKTSQVLGLGLEGCMSNTEDQTVLGGVGGLDCTGRACFPGTTVEAVCAAASPREVSPKAVPNRSQLRGTIGAAEGGDERCPGSGSSPSSLACGRSSHGQVNAAVLNDSPKHPLLAKPLNAVAIAARNMDEQGRLCGKDVAQGGLMSCRAEDCHSPSNANLQIKGGRQPLNPSRKPVAIKRGQRDVKSMKQSTLTPFFKGLPEAAPPPASLGTSLYRKSCGAASKGASSAAAGEVAAVDDDASKIVRGVPDQQPTSNQLPAGSRYKYYIACTSVDASIIEKLKMSIKSMGSAKLCAEGYEDGLVTHLVIGAERRTIKVLIAIANGAIMVSPQWLVDCLDKGVWLPEDGQYRTQYKFSETSDRVRGFKLQDGAGSQRLRLLQGLGVTVHCIATQQSSRASEHRAGLQRLVVALGGRVVPTRACDVCIMCSGTTKTAHGLPPGAKTVLETWLLQIAETQQLTDMNGFLWHCRRG